MSARTTLLLWAGLVIGISFVATPVKFQAETLTRAAALDVGRHTFAMSHWVQLALAAVATWQARRAWRPVLAATGLLLVQMIVLMPLLDERARTIIAGGEPTGASPHLFYVALELAKLALLLWPFSTLTLRKTIP